MRLYCAFCGKERAEDAEVIVRELVRKYILAASRPSTQTGEKT